MDISSNQDRLYNLSNLKAITKGNQLLLTTILEAFIREVSTSVAAIDASYKTNNFGAIAEFAHSIKPNIDSLEIVSLKHVIRNIEQDAKSDRHDRLNADINTLKIISAQVIDQLKAWELS